MDSLQDTRALGLCIGASSIKAVELDVTDGRPAISRTRVANHDCHAKECLQRVLLDFPLESFQHGCVTGRKHKNLINLPTVTEPEAVEQALQYVLRSHPNNGHGFDALLSLGSENFIVYELTPAGTIAGIRTGNKCGSGTGEFFLQQLRRMDVSLADASSLARSAEPYSVCGRCSVFCKSDCTHALNKGIPADRVLAGLGNMIADKVLEILGALPRRNIIAVGGVTKNDYVMDQLRQKIRNLYVPEEAGVFEALGAAICAARQQSPKPKQFRFAARHSTFGTLEPLKDAQHLVTFREHPGGQARHDDETVLGLDVGSTTTKATLVLSLIHISEPTRRH